MIGKQVFEVTDSHTEIRWSLTNEQLAFTMKVNHSLHVIPHSTHPSLSSCVV